MRRFAPLAAALALLSLAPLALGPAQAAEVPTETARLDGARITLHLHPFLDATELATLRLVMTNSQALAIFLPDAAAGGYAAIAVAPDEGFIRGGQPVASAAALGGLADAAAAQAAALAACEAKRSTAAACVVVMEISP